MHRAVTSSRLWQTALALTLALSLVPQAFVFGQVNSWLKPTSGDWQESQWSLGTLPNLGQSVFITNAGWKAIAVTPVTAQNFPQSLTMQSLTVGAAVDSRNVLLLNYAGFDVPLTTRFCRVEANAAISIVASAMLLNGGGGEGMSVGGEVTQDEFSQVTGQQIDVGYIGPGIYNLSSGTLAVSNLWIGGSSRGVFNQAGGSNGVAVIHLEPTGTYNLQGGDFNSEVYFENTYSDSSLFRQTGGHVYHALTMHRGRYQLEGGINHAGVVAPIYAWGDGSAVVIQTGGTNLGPLDIGFNGSGTYTLSNGVSQGSLRLGGRGVFIQWGGYQAVPGSLSIGGEWVGRNDWGLGSFTLNQGTLGCDSLYAEGYYTQNGGTNVVRGDILVQQSISQGVRLRMNGGLLQANSMSALRGVLVSGGQLILRNDLSIQSSIPGSYSWYGPDVSVTGGQIVVSNLLLRGTIAFIAGGIQQSGTLVVQNGRLLPGSGSHQLGRLRLDSNGTQMDSEILLPADAACAASFGASSTFPWASDARLSITNWAGSAGGGGAHQIRFGNSSSGLTPQQLSQVLFQNPAGFPPGSYFASILPTGEIVPGTAQSTTAPMLQLTRQADGTVQITVHGQTNVDYAIEFSSDLMSWQFWTNQLAANGTAFFVDTTAVTETRRFYRVFAH